MKHQQLEDRLIEYATQVIKMTDGLPPIFASKHLGEQIIRSSTSVALNYGEAQVAESRADFIHKMKICLKELNETFVCLKILTTNGYLDADSSSLLFNESNELISIFIVSLKTARQNQKRKEN